jgi:hypothetical protein
MKRKGWRERPITALYWWWIPALLAVGLQNGGSTIAALVVLAVGLGLVWVIYR